MSFILRANHSRSSM